MYKRRRLLPSIHIKVDESKITLIDANNVKILSLNKELIDLSVYDPIILTDENDMIITDSQDNIIELN